MTTRNYTLRRKRKLSSGKYGVIYNFHIRPEENIHFDVDNEARVNNYIIENQHFSEHRNKCNITDLTTSAT